MPKTVITPVQAIPGEPSSAPLITYGATDVANGNKVSLAKQLLLLFKNGDVAQQTITITSGADQLGRTRTVVITLAAGAERVFGPIKGANWAQTAGDDIGSLIFASSDADVTCAALFLN